MRQIKATNKAANASHIQRKGIRPRLSTKRKTVWLVMATLLAWCLMPAVGTATDRITISNTLWTVWGTADAVPTTSNPDECLDQYAGVKLIGDDETDTT